MWVGWVAHTVADVSVAVMTMDFTVRESQALDAVAAEWACQEALQRAVRGWCSWTGVHLRRRLACEQVTIPVSSSDVL